MNAHTLYDLIEADHLRLVDRTARLRRRRSATGRATVRSRWWHALWHPPHPEGRDLLPTLPAPLRVR